MIGAAVVSSRSTVETAVRRRLGRRACAATSVSAAPPIAAPAPPQGPASVPACGEPAERLVVDLRQELFHARLTHRRRLDHELARRPPERHLVDPVPGPVTLPPCGKTCRHEVRAAN